MIELNEEVVRRIASAIDDGKTLTAAYVDVDGKPHISFYGSTHVHRPSELAIWVRSPTSALLQTLPTKPHLAFIYGDISSRFYATFEGRGRIETQADIRTEIYETMHPIERKFEPDMAGTAVVVELDTVTLLTKAGKEVLTRG